MPEDDSQQVSSASKTSPNAPSPISSNEQQVTPPLWFGWRGSRQVGRRTGASGDAIVSATCDRWTSATPATIRRCSSRSRMSLSPTSARTSSQSIASPSAIDALSLLRGSLAASIRGNADKPLPVRAGARRPVHLEPHDRPAPQFERHHT